MKMNLKKWTAKWTAVIMAAAISCSVPVYASSIEDLTQEAEQILEDSDLMSLISDPEKLADIILYVKNVLNQEGITDEDISYAIDTAADEIGIVLEDSEKETILKLVNRFKDVNIEREDLIKYINRAYGIMESLGAEEGNVGSFIEKGMNFIMSFFE